MKILSNADVAELLPMAEAIDVIDTTMRGVSDGTAQLPLRHVVPVGGANMMGVMSGSLAEPSCYGVKLVSLFPGNPDKGLSGHRGAVVLFEAETGGAVAMMDAGLLTAIRTAAASAVATRALARPDAERLTIIGTGEQAEHHLAAMLAVRPIAHVHIVGRRAEKAAAMAVHAGHAYPALVITHGTDVQTGIKGADIICTVTNSATPVLQGAWLEPGQHVNIVGSSVASKREVDADVVTRCEYFFDYRPSLLAQAGEIVEGLKAGAFTESDLKSEIGSVLNGAPGRSSAQAITAYRSLGVVAQDLAAAQHVLDRAVAEGRGQDASF
ncbi:ornithine cyclodeaminase family protein [Pararhodobacter zhoushanensis]|uniref:ornithine cyclodeaminase family protein n=1 Tax=Pararhodobacter zhoushanensis TaxID=2479545 RepID=UPI000F8E0E72|nr:ornithine cyclodeaminase family protein [Pararhodobacter zhoushanensis]